MKRSHPHPVHFNPALVAQGSTRPKAVLTKMQQLEPVQLYIKCIDTAVKGCVYALL